VEPFQGAATGVGGILRDIFTMGARPIALLNALRFGPLEEGRNVGLMEGVVAGIAHYGNCVGVPTVGGEVAFDSSYSGNPLVNAMALGLMETEEIVRSGASGVGNPVVYVGSTTGRDGMGGASFASAELTEASLDDRPAVQVGDPFLEKGLIEACLEAFQSGDVVAAQDMGAAGLTCSCSEMAAKGGVGVELDLDLVPAREKGMTAYEFLLSESQERMLFVVAKGREEALMARFRRWGLQAAVVGRVLAENVVRVLQHGEVAAEVPANALADDTPINQHSLISEPPAEIQAHWRWTEDQLPPASAKGIGSRSWNQVLLALLDDPTIASKRWVYRQYDQQVQANTVVPPAAPMRPWCACGPNRALGRWRRPAVVWRRWSIVRTAGWPWTRSGAPWRRWPRRPATSAASVPNRLPLPTTSISRRRTPIRATGSWPWPARASRRPAAPWIPP
jgi:phosphoribosylformylglycinamidine synthase